MALATQTNFTPGSPGVGDPYFPLEGNGGYNVVHYNLDLSYDPASHHLGGSNTITATATQNLSRFDLDLVGYTVSRVQVNGAAATFRRVGPELVITPSKGLPIGKRFVVEVWYAGVPHTIIGSPIVFGAPYGWIYTKDGAFVGCEPNAARTWYPANDHPSDKASFTFDITVPKSRKVVANGSLLTQRVRGDQATFVWRETQPMATYLATIDIGRWDFHSTTTPAGIPEFVAVDPTLASQARTDHIIALTGRITDFWARSFGRYPFSSTGGIVDHVPHVGFSLETQTRPLYGFVPSSGTASHELSHQWFGDSVSVQTWQNIWLNEGFATYSSWFWTEHTGGPTTWRQANGLYGGIPAGSDFWKQSIADPQRNTMFSPAVYYRGALTLAALRHRIGDQDFATLLRTWVQVHRYRNATTAQFVALAEKVSGQRLGQFFYVWLWKQAKPSQL